jgi:flavin-dependent dehydrogenase
MQQPPEPIGPFDVAIAGAGLAGGSLALRLARSGARVALLDASRFPRPKLCGEYLSPEGVEALGRLGLGDRIAEAGGEPIGRVRLSTPRGRVLEAEVSGPGGAMGLGLSRSVLDDRIVSEAQSAGVAVFEGCRVGGAVVEGGRVVGLRARASGEAEGFAIRARVVVAADGRHSALVRQTGQTRPRSRLPTRPALLGLKRHLRVRDATAAEPAGTVGLHLVPGGYGGTCRIEGDLTNFCALIPESAVNRNRGDLDRATAEVFGSNPTLAGLLGASEPVGPWKTVAGVRVEISTPTLPGILYAGDCQGTVDPLGGQGMTMALLGAEMLAPIVLEALAKANGGVSPALQRAVLSAWRRRFDRRVRLCRLFHHMLVRPRFIDVACAFPRLAPRVLAGCVRRTRDRARATPNHLDNSR